MINLKAASARATQKEEHSGDYQDFQRLVVDLWAVMRYPHTHPVAMLLGVANRDNVPLFFLQSWHREPSRLRVISQHDTVEAANGSVLWDRSVVDRVPA